MHAHALAHACTGMPTRTWVPVSNLACRCSPPTRLCMSQRTRPILLALQNVLGSWDPQPFPKNFKTIGKFLLKVDDNRLGGCLRCIVKRGGNRYLSKINFSLREAGYISPVKVQKVPISLAVYSLTPERLCGFYRHTLSTSTLHLTGVDKRFVSLGIVFKVSSSGTLYQLYFFLRC